MDLCMIACGLELLVPLEQLALQLGAIAQRVA